MQCASSTTARDTARACISAMNCGSASRSGVTSTMRAVPSTSAASACARVGASSVLLNSTAQTPCARSFSHWSFMRAIRGEMTSVHPGSSMAGKLVAQ